MPSPLGLAEKTPKSYDSLLGSAEHTVGQCLPSPSKNKSRRRHKLSLPAVSRGTAEVAEALALLEKEYDQTNGKHAQNPVAVDDEEMDASLFEDEWLNQVGDGNVDVAQEMDETLKSEEAEDEAEEEDDNEDSTAKLKLVARWQQLLPILVPPYLEYVSRTIAKIELPPSLSVLGAPCTAGRRCSPKKSQLLCLWQDCAPSFLLGSLI